MLEITNPKDVNGTELHENDRVRYIGKSNLHQSFYDGTALTVTPNTKVTIRRIYLKSHEISIEAEGHNHSLVVMPNQLEKF